MNRRRFLAFLGLAPATHKLLTAGTAPEPIKPLSVTAKIDDRTQWTLEQATRRHYDEIGQVQTVISDDYWTLTRTIRIRLDDPLLNDPLFHKPLMLGQVVSLVEINAPLYFLRMNEDWLVESERYFHIRGSVERVTVWRSYWKNYAA